MEDSRFEEVVYLFVDGQVAAELPFAQFEQHVDRQLPIEGAPPGASVCRGGYVLVGPELRIHGLVFFLVHIDDCGRVDKNFNVPLPYLAKNAGAGPDLGYGPVPLACRGSCSVPWHANNLWDPSVDDATNPMDALVAAVQRNRLGLTPQKTPRTPIVSPRLGVGAQIAELSAAHTATLMDLQRQHEEELANQRELLEGQLERYRLEVERLKTALRALQEEPRISIGGY